MIRGLRATLALLALVSAASSARGEEKGPIEDNSFLVEEAYNQESRVVQHIFTWMRAREGGAWVFAFTQEWPALGQRHQLSYTIPVERLADAESGARGLGDAGLNYRFQWLGVHGGPVAFAPRLSVLFPTGDSDRGLGAAAAGLQVNLPVSVTLSRRLVSHTNAGLTRIRAGTPPAIPVADTSPWAARRGVNLGQSLIWLPAPEFNVMLELAWDRSDASGVPGDADREEHLLLSPGVRWAHDLANGLQVVPGVAVPIGLGASRGQEALYLYLSLEHGF